MFGEQLGWANLSIDIIQLLFSLFRRNTAKLLIQNPVAVRKVQRSSLSDKLKLQQGRSGFIAGNIS